ncbi:flagellar biosynthetic protein FliR [Enterococcus bulliens]
MLEASLLIFVRILFFILLCPVFSSKTVPNLVKISFSVILTIVVIQVLPIEQLQGYSWNILLIVYIIKEILFGFALGFLSQLVFVGIEMAGQLIDFQVGFSMAQVYDPTFQMSASPYGKLYYWLGISLFFILDLHQLVIKGLVESFQLVPIGTVSFNGVKIEGIIQLFLKVVEIGLNLAAPIVIALLVIDLILGILSRAVPQINLLMLSLSIKTGISFCFFLYLIPNIFHYLSKVLPLSYQYVEQLIQSF